MKLIPTSGLDDKREITVLLAVKLAGEYLPPQILFQGETKRRHPTTEFPSEWDVWHSEHYWSNDTTMLRYVQRVLFLFVEKKREVMGLEESHPCLTIYGVFRCQQTPIVCDILRKNNIHHVNVPANCTDKLQPLNILVNKTF